MHLGMIHFWHTAPAPWAHSGRTRGERRRGPGVLARPTRIRPVLDPAAAATLLRARRTVHLFRPERPPEALVLEAFDAARFAPNHRLTEPWRFYLLGPETAARVVALDAELARAARGEAAAEIRRARWSAIPGWAVVTCRTSPEDPLREREDYAACACALQSAMLYLWSAGVGTKWTTGPVTREARFYEILGIERTEEKVVSLLWYGYPEAVPEARRRPLAEVLTRLP